MNSLEDHLKSLKSSDKVVQLKAIRSLRAFPERRAIWALAECVASAEPTVAEAAMEEIKQFDHTALKHTFAPALVNRDKVPTAMRCMAATLLAFAYNDQEAVALLVMVSDRDQDERVRAAAGKAALRAAAFKAGVE